MTALSPANNKPHSDQAKIDQNAASYSRPRRLSSVEDLAQAGLLPEGDPDAYRALARHYDIGISDHIAASLSAKESPHNDPVGAQYIPTLAELDVQNWENDDPIGDEKYAPVRGIVHRYPDRVLLKVTPVCAVYCRYCFRKEMIGTSAQHLNDDDFVRALSYIKNTPEIWEVILSGGDPLVLSPRRLQKIIDALNQVTHVKNIRIHTRIPVAKPNQINETLLSVLESVSKGLTIVIHINHVNELTPEAERAIFSLRRLPVSLLSQSVLLKGVNDDEKTLEDLFRHLAVLNIHPYYLHHLDKAKGTKHFRVPIWRGKEIMRRLRGHVSGICLPQYTLDIPHGHGKIPINDGTVQHLENGLYKVEDYKGGLHYYDDECGPPPERLK